MRRRTLLAVAAAFVLLAAPWVLPPFYVGIFAYAGIYALADVNPPPS